MQTDVQTTERPAAFAALAGSAIPCPFCGGTKITVEWEPCPPLDPTDTNRRWFAECASCSCQGPFCQKEPEVIPAWNKRAVLTFHAFRAANVSRCLKWHPKGIESWSPSDWLTAVTGELGELASLLKMRNRERDGLAGNKFSPTDKQIADEVADVVTYLDLLAYVLGVDMGRAAVEKFNAISERVGFPDRLPNSDYQTPV